MPLTEQRQECARRPAAQARTPADKVMVQGGLDWVVVVDPLGLVALS